MTSLPERPKKRLGLVIDLDICVGCHACAVACKAWNTQISRSITRPRRFFGLSGKLVTRLPPSGFG
ncbi:MAG: hypothetical protein AAFV96_12410, partial [Pseudomonadota bacterium]